MVNRTSVLDDYAFIKGEMEKIRKQKEESYKENIPVTKDESTNDDYPYDEGCFWLGRDVMNKHHERIGDHPIGSRPRES